MSLEEVFAVNNIPRCTVHGQMKTLDRMEDFAEPRKPQGNSLPPPSSTKHGWIPYEFIIKSRRVVGSEEIDLTEQWRQYP